MFLVFGKYSVINNLRSSWNYWIWGLAALLCTFVKAFAPTCLSLRLANAKHSLFLERRSSVSIWNGFLLMLLVYRSLSLYPLFIFLIIFWNTRWYNIIRAGNAEGYEPAAQQTNFRKVFGGFLFSWNWFW